MIGKIVKGISGFYYVFVAGFGLVTCKAKGAFRNEGIKPLVGDNVELDLISEEAKEGNIIKILPRVNSLIRPAVANVDQALVIFAVTYPSPNLNLLDRFLVTMEQNELPVTICFNKSDLTLENRQQLSEIYEKAGYKVIFASAKEGMGIDDIRQALKGKTSTVAGPSGVGKSSIINLLTDAHDMETGGLSEKIQRGKHTTRHSELLPIDDDTFIMDTPGFSSIFVPEVESIELFELFREFNQYECNCRFAGCAHYKEPDCGIKKAVLDGLIAESRYENYVQMYEEVVARKKY